jgi:hypothetical protein
MTHRIRYALISVALASAVCACSSPRQPQPAASAPAGSQLWGDLKPVVSVKELMRDMLDPASDFVFDAVRTDVTPKGAVDSVPKTDEDWDRIRVGAVTLAEGVYLLKIRRPFTPPGDENDSGPGGTELTPAEITAKVERDPVEWNARIEALRNVGLEVMDIVKRKDVKELWDAGENLDQACENCHRSYWYPKEDAQFYKKLDQRLREFPAPSRGRP